MNKMRQFFKKNLLRYFCPDLYVKSVTSIDLSLLKEKGFNTMILDLDNTLLSWKAQEISEPVLAWLQEAQKLSLKILLLSNSLPKRVLRLSQTMGIPAIPRAAKPRKKVFREAMQILQSKPEESVIIGDQLFTDVLGGKRSGLFTILVMPVDRKEFFATGLIRIPEKILIGLLQKYGFMENISNCPQQISNKHLTEK